VIPRYFIVAERDHELQNPISEDKLRLLGERLRLGPGARVLDIASGRGGPAVPLACEFGCTIEGIEIAPAFHAVANVDRTAARNNAGRAVGQRRRKRTDHRRNIDAAGIRGETVV